MDSERITGYLKRIGLDDFDQTEPNRWHVTFPCDTHDIESFHVEIYLTNDWATFSSIVIKSMYGDHLSDYYDFLFRLNHYINGLKFALTPDGEAILIQAERHVSELTHERFKEVFEQLLYFYIEWYPRLVEYAADDFKLKFRKRPRKEGLIKQLLSSLIDPGESGDPPRLIGSDIPVQGEVQVSSSLSDEEQGAIEKTIVFEVKIQGQSRRMDFLHQSADKDLKPVFTEVIRKLADELEVDPEKIRQQILRS
jgi:hypothetical protein